MREEEFSKIKKGTKYTRRGERHGGEDTGKAVMEMKSNPICKSSPGQPDFSVKYEDTLFPWNPGRVRGKFSSK